MPSSLPPPTTAETPSTSPPSIHSPPLGTLSLLRCRSTLPSTSSSATLPSSPVTSQFSSSPSRADSFSSPPPPTISSPPSPIPWSLARTPAPGPPAHSSPLLADGAPRGPPTAPSTSPAELDLSSPRCRKIGREMEPSQIRIIL
ncbi:hypothetical protein LINPERPRIM_LOCUS5992 [Linum perenne]